ncbi:MAG: NPP1 family protein [Fluviicoccus sp.]|uniref:NPP1 family protein n=1 Tax=Fluviicoccus sp. TaxID=2003552 RepID=UPI002717C9A7|nr:NPP1 family protein [Fluviicoccus sp.]MDO8331615.1 NPP1 family protein [Fluviicoccus sp.]
MRSILASLALAAGLLSAPAAHALYNPADLLATLQFDGTDWFDTGEQNFPQAYRFTPYDADVEHNKENLIRFKIGGSVTGTGSTGWANRGPNDQRPAVYFHFVQSGGYDVYQYWLYYADNDWLNDHEHDWERYNVYVKNGVPTHVAISQHNGEQMVTWAKMAKDGTHPKIGVDGGAHAMKTGGEDGVQIRYNGAISKNGGRLDAGNGTTQPWVIYSNDVGFAGTTPFTQTPNVFYYGDPAYSTNSAEFGDLRDAPWIRAEWNSPALP